MVSTISNFENDLPNEIPRANYVRTSQRAPHAHAHTYPAPISHTRLRTHAPARALMSSRANMPCELPCPCTNVPCAPRCSRAITSHKKHKFSMRCLNETFGSFLSFSCEIKLHMKSARQAGMSLHSFWEFSSKFLHFSFQVEAFNGCHDKLCVIKWFDFCLSRTLRITGTYR